MNNLNHLFTQKMLLKKFVLLSILIIAYSMIYNTIWSTNTNKTENKDNNTNSKLIVKYFENYKFNEFNIPIGKNELKSQNDLNTKYHWKFVFQKVKQQIGDEIVKGLILIQISYHEPGGKMVDDDVTGIAQIKYTYNEKNLRIQEEYFDSVGTIAERFGSIHKIEYYYDNKNREVEQRYYSKFAKMTTGIAITRYKYNNNGYLIEQSYFDRDNKPILDSEEIAIYRFEYNDKGQLVEESYHDVNGMKKENIHGVMFVRYTYWETGDYKDLPKTIRKYNKKGVEIDEDNN